ncbi:toxin C-terminal domain-containing protein [Paenibacillus agricola]|uniref:toxin C-terminal domain-containing protein n=1 Tax=Paenibacillus agricola TaxID=2716264 RepID=UPI001A9D294C|nr:toxin C-terminal domain-containing protein [Paenibacillus agricola]
MILFVQKSRILNYPILQELYINFKKALSIFNFTSFLKAQLKSNNIPLKNSQLDDLAKYLGYTITRQCVKGKPVYTKGRLCIVQDVSSHIGGTWKMADSISNLQSKSSRIGTFDPLLNYMGK